MRHYVTIRCALLGLIWLAVSGPAADALTVTVAGHKIAGSPAPSVEEGVVWGPAAACAEALGATVVWDQAEGRLTITTRPAKTVVVKAGEQALSTEGGAQPLPAAPRIVDGVLICPLQPLLEALGCVVHWQPQDERLVANLTVLAVQVRGDDDGVGVFIQTSGPVEAHTNWVANPERAFVDLPGVEIVQKPVTTLVNQANVRRVRFGQFRQDPPIARFVMDLADRRPAVWHPRADGCGGTFVMGHLDGDEPIIDRRRIDFEQVLISRAEDASSAVTCRFSGPVLPVIDVTYDPPAVIVQFPDVTAPPHRLQEPGDGEFVDRLTVSADERTGWTTLRLQMRQLIQFRSSCDSADSQFTIKFRRQNLQGRLVVLDPGHGGKDPGARGRCLLEKDVNLDVARRVAAGLLRAGARPVLTRDDDVYIDLFERVALANKLAADAFVSIHCNAMPKPDTRQGTETYWYTRDSKCLAVIMHRQLVDKLKRRDNGVRRARFVVVRETVMPSCLVELMYLNDRNEEKLLGEEHIRQLAAAAVVEGLRQYFEGTEAGACSMCPGRRKEA